MEWWQVEWLSHICLFICIFLCLSEIIECEYPSPQKWVSEKPHKEAIGKRFWMTNPVLTLLWSSGLFLYISFSSPHNKSCTLLPYFNVSSFCWEVPHFFTDLSFCVFFLLPFTLRRFLCCWMTRDHRCSICISGWLKLQGLFSSVARLPLGKQG